jgi:dihydrofolate reductase
MISMISILGRNGAIGNNGGLLWKLPADMTHFKEITLGHTVIMGRKTFASIGRPLPDRANIVLSRDVDYDADECILCQSLEEALGKAHGDEIFIIGGGEIYEQAIFLADKLYLTIVDDQPEEADTFFPDYSEFKTVLSEEQHQHNDLKYTFTELMR